MESAQTGDCVLCDKSSAAPLFSRLVSEHMGRHIRLTGADVLRALRPTFDPHSFFSPQNSWQKKDVRALLFGADVSRRGVWGSRASQEAFRRRLSARDRWERGELRDECICAEHICAVHPQRGT